MIFITFLLAIPGILMQTSRGWLKAHGAMVVVCGIFTLVIGLDIWFETLKTRENLGFLWNQQSNDVQSLLQRGVRFFSLPICPHFLLPSINANSPTARLLRLPEQHLSTIRARHDMFKPASSTRQRRLRTSILVIREQFLGYRVYGRFWNRGL